MLQYLNSPDIEIFSPVILDFCYVKKYKQKMHFNAHFLVLLAFFKDCFTQHDSNFEKVIKTGCSGLT